MLDIWQIALLIGLPSALTSAIFGFGVWYLKKTIEKREREHEKKEEDRKKLDLQILACINASLTLGGATARAVQRIPDAHCNGDMHKALEYATEVKHDLKSFLMAQGVNHLHDE